MDNRFNSGDIVQHFKREMLSEEERATNKYLYEIIGVALHSEAREPMMVYRPLYDDGGLYVRPLEMFLSEVDHEKYPDVKQKYRFEKVVLDNNPDIVISVEEMRAADKHTIEKGTPSKELMRRAAQGIFDAVDPGWSDNKTLVVCGSGNNGGDGYTLAEIMKNQGHDVTLMRTSEKFSEDGEYYYNRCKSLSVGEVEFANCNFEGYDIIVDCILGTGFSGVPRDNIASVIEKINEAGKKDAFVVSADINSGMNGDTGEAEIAVKSDLTVSIGYYKYGLFRGRSKELIGKLVNVDIGIELSREN